MKLFKRIILILLTIGIGYYLVSYSSESKKYEILNQILEDTNLTPKIICSNEETIAFNKEIFNEFNLYDKPSIYAQVILQNPKIDLGLNHKIGDTKIITDCSLEIKTTKLNEKNFKIEQAIFSKISLPILSIDKKTAVIQIENNCGFLCGRSVIIYAFKINNGKWKIINKKETFFK